VSPVLWGHLAYRARSSYIALRALEVKTREDAQALKGVLLYVPREVLPAPDDEDDFYYSDLVGLEVKTQSGQRMGKIVAVHEFGAGDMLEIKPNAKMAAKAAEKDGKAPQSFFHPFTKAAVPKVDLKAGRVIINIVEPENGRDTNAS